VFVIAHDISEGMIWMICVGWTNPYAYGDVLIARLFVGHQMAARRW